MYERKLVVPLSLISRHAHVALALSAMETGTTYRDYGVPIQNMGTRQGKLLLGEHTIFLNRKLVVPVLKIIKLAPLARCIRFFKFVILKMSI